MANDRSAGTVNVNGQRFNTPTLNAYRPTGYGPQTVGVPMITPSQPPFVGGGAGASGSPNVVDNVGGYGTAGNNNLATMLAGNNPWSLKHSPVLWAIFGLLLSVVLLRHVHWRETLLEGEAGGRVGPARANADAAVD